MKNWKKVLLACLCLATAGAPAVSAMPVMASETNIGEAPVVEGLLKENGKIYYYKDGSAVKKSWITVDGYKYYFGKDGVAYAAGSDRNVLVKKIGSSYYGFDKNGHMIAGKFQNVKIKSGSKTVTYRYYFTSSGKAYAGKKTAAGTEILIKKINGKQYGFLEYGRMAKGIYFNAKTNKLCYFNKSNGVYSASQSKKLNNAAKYQQNSAELKKLLGTAKKTEKVTGCYISASEGNEYLIYYDNVVLNVARYYSGKEIILGVMSK